MQKIRTRFKGTRWLLLKNPWNLSSGQKERLSTLVRWNAPLVRAWYLKESFQLFWPIVSRGVPSSICSSG